jgi:uroporphyrin-III C-methyltransferase / precorrin-2 dehydrogenase / sirohydrochlorin ferrochelatase
VSFRYPVTLDLEGRRCVLIGGGSIAAQKLPALITAGAVITVIAEAIGDEVRNAARDRDVALITRPYAEGDLDNAFLAIAATDDGAVNERAFNEAEAKGVLFNAVDDIDHCHFAAPATVKRNDFMLAISTNGKAPALAKRVRKRLAHEFGPEYGELVDLLGEVREETLAKRRIDFDTWAERWQLALDHDVLGLVREKRIEDAKGAVRHALETGSPTARLVAFPRSAKNPEPGRVAIVGAGPGDPELITVRGKNALGEADVVVCDRLVHPSLVHNKRTIYVGKKPGQHYASQKEINELLVELARLGHNVVRLKGGDPFVFGRGSEEAEVLAEAGIDFEVVPAPTSAVAALGAAGIPVTDRRFSSSFAVVTGHCVAEGGIDWEGLADSVDTIVVLMGIAKLGEIADALVTAGRDPATPAAIVENATWDTQRTLVCTLEELAATAGSATVQSPATVVIGEVVSVRERMLPRHDSRSGTFG